MSIFGAIVSKVLSHPAEAATAVARPADAAPAPVEEVGAAPATSTPDAGAPAADAAAPTVTATAAAAPAVDVAAVLDAKLAAQSDDLDWRHSIVDLMKLLGLDSSLSERKQLAKELGYTEDISDSAAMNIWLHKQVMQKLAENGGNVPADLR